jgi:nucleotide-binding universal stress UspA family protein
VSSEPCEVTVQHPECTRPGAGTPLRVLLAVDGSPASQTAAALVAHLFRGSNCGITVLTVREDERGDWTSPLGPAVDLLCHCTGTIRTELRHGKPGGEIVRFASETRPDLLVLGSHGRRGLVRLVLGSVAEYVLHHTASSVLIARRDRITRALVGIDGSAASLRAADLLGRLLPLRDTDVRLFHALDEAAPPPPAGAEGPPVAAPHVELKKQARHARLTNLEAIAAELRTSGLRASVELSEGDAATGLLTLAENLEADLIAVGKGDQRPAARLLLGSVSDRLVREAECSVLVVSEHQGTDAAHDTGG